MQMRKWHIGFAWVTATLVLCASLALVAAPAPLRPWQQRQQQKNSVFHFENPGPVVPQSALDRLVFAKLEQMKIQPAGLASDAVFVRRVFFDVIGTLPTAAEAREFIESKDPNKRAKLIDQLLQRDEFADYWSLKWNDLLRVKAEFPINLWPNAVQCYHRWIRTSIKENKPYDKFARELLTASGSNFRVPPVNFYRATQDKEPRGLAQAVALTFMGMRAENWPKEKLDGLAAFFSQMGYKSTAEWKEEIVYFDLTKAATRPSTAVFPDGTSIALPGDRDPREILADWLVNPKNPYFARTIANRSWYWLVGRGIVHEPDDFRPDNPPKNPELLAYLERELIAAKWDLKQLFRLILNSKTYQLSSIPRSNSPEAEAYFAYYPIRRMEAEVLIDAICQITGTTEKYSSPIPEPFTFIPEEQRSIALGDGSITSPFLEMFGRPSRDTGLESERTNKPTASQRLHMLNSSHIQKKLESGRKMNALLSTKGSEREMLNNLYLTILSRYPTDDEIKVAQAHARSPNVKSTREAMIDVAWALINSAEFLYRH